MARHREAQPLPAARVPVPPPSRARGTSIVTWAAQLVAVVRSMRPSQWTKNALVLLAAVFARRLTDLATVERSLLGFCAFCLAASAVYILNDLADRQRDRLHPRKRMRPLAAGQLSPAVATGAVVACVLGAGLFARAVALREPAAAHDIFAPWGGSGLLFAAAVGGYIAINYAYSVGLKDRVLLDVFIIAAGFALRALAGAFAASVPISPWFYLCTLFLALLLALGKRRAELTELSADAGAHRAILRQYSLPLIDQLMNVMVTATLITYSLYTFQAENSNYALMLTIPIVLFGIFRYLYLVYVKGEGGRPDELLWRDPQILGAVALCLAVFLVVLYGLPLAHR
jgi:4-hydroxybenzoate polyprenyltransferase